MIVENLINILFVPIEFLLGLLPNFSWTITIATGSTLVQLFNVACYLLPIHTITHILGLIISITILRIVISLVKLVLNALPFF